jgi:hypothetical protein
LGRVEESAEEDSVVDDTVVEDTVVEDSGLEDTVMEKLLSGMLSWLWGNYCIGGHLAVVERLLAAHRFHEIYLPR